MKKNIEKAVRLINPHGREVLVSEEEAKRLLSQVPEKKKAVKEFKRADTHMVKDSSITILAYRVEDKKGKVFTLTGSEYKKLNKTEKGKLKVLDEIKTDHVRVTVKASGEDSIIPVSEFIEKEKTGDVIFVEEVEDTSGK